MSQYHSFPNKLLTIKKGGEERVKDIEQAVCTCWGIPVEYLKMRRNKRSYSEPFHVVTVLILEFTTINRDKVDEMYGRKRTASYHSEKSVRSLEFSDIKFRERMRQVRIHLTQVFVKQEEESINEIKKELEHEALLDEARN